MLENFSLSVGILASILAVLGTVVAATWKLSQLNTKVEAAHDDLKSMATKEQAKAIQDSLADHISAKSDDLARRLEIVATKLEHAATKEDLGEIREDLRNLLRIVTERGSSAGR